VKQVINTQIYKFTVYKTTNIFTKTVLEIIVANKKLIYRVKGMYVKYFLKAALNFALSFLRIVTLGGILLKIFMPAYNVLL